MKLIVLKNNLRDGLDSVGKAIGSSVNLQVLGNVLIKTEGNQIKLSSTNLELAITKNVFGKVVEEGSVTVPYSTISSLVSNLTSERINLSKTETNGLDIQTDNYQATIQGIDEKEFPIIPKIKKDKDYLEIGQDVLKIAITKVVVAGEASDLRPEIAGVLFKSDHGTLKLVATDSFRLAEATISDDSLKNNFKEGILTTIPLKTTQDLVKILGEEKVVKIYIENNQVLFESDSISIISRIIDGKFPDYSAIVPDSIDTEIVVNRDELISSLKLASSFTSRTNDIKLSTKDKKIVEIYSSDDSVGKNKYLLPAKINGPETEATFNWKYLIDGVRVGSTKDVQLGLSGSDKPAVIKNPGDNQYFYILMPIKSS